MDKVRKAPDALLEGGRGGEGEERSVIIKYKTNPGMAANSLMMEIMHCQLTFWR